MAGRGEHWDRTLDTKRLPDQWPTWARRLFLCTLPISIPLYVVVVIMPWAFMSAAAHFVDWVETMWNTRER